MATFRRIAVSGSHAGAIMGLVVAPSHRCLLVIPQPLNTSQRSSTQLSALLKSLQSSSQQGPDVLQQLTEGKRDMSSQRGSILHVGQHLPLQLLCLRFRLAASTQLWKAEEKNTLREVVWIQHPLVKLSASHMALARKKGSCRVPLQPDAAVD